MRPVRRITALEALRDACNLGRSYIAIEGPEYCVWLCDEVRRQAEQVHRERQERPPSPPYCAERVHRAPSREETLHYLDAMLGWIATLYTNDLVEPDMRLVAWIVSWGQCQYSISDTDPPVCVTATEDYVLTAFAGRPAMNRADLARLSGVEHAHRVLAQLRHRYPEFAPAIRLPGSRGQGGYRALVRRRINAC
ncbi:MAG: hypothetical protein JNM56_40740 [Planctomycetia bacterium]|nr:hypothetical protein [Planctomycetia bacterium]